MDENLKERILKTSNYIGEFSTKDLLSELKNHTIGNIAYCILEDQFVYLNENNEWQEINSKNIDSIFPSLNTNMSLYDVNKTLVEQMEPLSKHKINEKIILLNCFHSSLKNNFYMLLFRDINYYTIFNLNKDNKFCMNFGEEVADCLKQFTVYSIDKEDNGIEIWIKDEEKGAIVGYLFPYDAGVVDFRG